MTLRSCYARMSGGKENGVDNVTNGESERKKEYEYDEKREKISCIRSFADE